MLPESSSEAKPIDAGVSKVCTQSGAFALVLSLALASTIPYWLQGKEDLAFGKYPALRSELATQVELLDDSGAWRRYKDTHPDAESAPLAQLNGATVQVPLTRTIAAGQSAARTEAGRMIPASPTKLSVATDTGIDEIRRANGFLVQLDDTDMLARSRKFSNFANISVYRWMSKRNVLVSRNEAVDGAEGCLQASIKKPAQQEAIGKDTLLGCLTLSDLRELSQFELIKLPDTTKYSGREGKEIEVALGVLPHTLYIASLAADTLLLLTLIFFGAFVRKLFHRRPFPPKERFSALFQDLVGRLRRFFLLYCYLSYRLPLSR